MSSQQQQPHQWFRFGSFFQGAQLQQITPPPQTTTTQQPAITPPALETQAPVGATIEVPVLRFPVTPAAVSNLTPTLPTHSGAATPSQIPQSTQIARPVGPLPRKLVFQRTPREETPPGPPARAGGASDEATIMRSVAAVMPPSAPTLSFRSPPTLIPVSRSPPQAAIPHSTTPPLPPTNASTPYASPMSRTPPSMQTSPNKEASPGAVFIRYSSLPKSPERKLSESTTLLTSPVQEPLSPSPSPPPPLVLPAKSSYQDSSPKASPTYVEPVSESNKFRQTNHLQSSGHDKAKHKNVLMQETLDKSRVTTSKEDVYDQTLPKTTKIKNGLKEKVKTVPKKLPNSGRFRTRLILDGVNRGAIMDLSNGEKKESSSFRGIGKKLGSVPDDGKEETTNPNHKKGMSIQSSSMRAFINNNVQGINNSIVFNSSCKEKDPGVHISLSGKGHVGKEEIMQKDKSK